MKTEDGPAPSNAFLQVMQTHDGGEAATDGAAPVSSPFRKDVERRVKVLRSLRHPTVAQIEVAQFWEEYLARTLFPASEVQKDVSEPIQKY